MHQYSTGLQIGREIGNAIDAVNYQAQMQQAFAQARMLYPTLGDTDLETAIRDYDQERLACEPDYCRFPEMQGLLDRHLGERAGFREVTGLSETAAAFHYSWTFYNSRRLNCRHVARYDLMPPPPSHCTNVFLPEGVEGVVVADNRDDVPAVWNRISVPAYCPTHLITNDTVPWQQGAASATIMLDEEPACSFPCNPFELMPDECLDDIHALVEFMTRYREFYGPGKFIWVDRQRRAVAVEKANCRVAFRWPEVAGAVCIGDFSYLDPELRAYKKSCLRRLMAAIGTTEENSLDWQYDLAADRRHARLLQLTNEEAARGATLWGALNVVADTELPFPDRVCVAGEKMLSGETATNWTLVQHAAVITGPSRRMLYRSIEDMDNLRSVITYTQKLMLGSGVEMQPAWQRDIDEGQCRFVELRVPA